MVRGRENLAHKCAVTFSHKIGSIFLHQREKSESHTLTDRQQGSLRERTYNQIEQRDLALSSKSQYVYHSRIPAVSTEYSSSQRIKSRKKSRLFRVASSSQSFARVFLITRCSNNRSICFPPMPKLEYMSSSCISPFQYDFKSAPKNKTGMCSSSDFDCTSLEYHGIQNS